MERIENISIETESPSIPAGAGATCTPCSVPTGNLLPLLHEIRHALNSWLDDGSIHVIDLGSIPMAPHEETQLLETLGLVSLIVTDLDSIGESDRAKTIPDRKKKYRTGNTTLKDWIPKSEQLDVLLLKKIAPH